MYRWEFRQYLTPISKCQSRLPESYQNEATYSEKCIEYEDGDHHLYGIEDICIQYENGEFHIRNL